MRGLQRFLRDGALRRQSANRSELSRLFEVAGRDLADARVIGVSEDRRFATAYNAALQLAPAVLRAEGFRTSGAAHHFVTISVLPELMGEEMQPTADYLNACRAKRNTVDYDAIGIATERDVAELIEEIERLCMQIDRWMATQHPELISRFGEE